VANDVTMRAPQRTAGGPNLGVPVVLLLMVSTVMMAVLTFVAARSLDRSAETSARQLAESLLLQTRRDTAKVAREASQIEAVREFIAGARDRAWADRQIGQYLRRIFGVSSVWLLDGRNRTLLGQVGDAPSEADALASMSSGLTTLLESARAAPAAGPGGAHGLLLLGGEVHAAAVAALEAGGGAPQPVLVVTSALDPRYLSLLAGVHFISGAALSGETEDTDRPAIRLEAPNGEILGHLVLDLAAPGTELLRQVWPAVASAFASMLLLVGLFVRRAERVRLQRVRLEQTLDRERELHQLKARFVNMVSHEIRTPLTTIRAATDLLTRYSQQLSPEERESELRAIQREVDVMSALVEDVLAIGRTEGDGFVLQPRPVDLEATVREVWAVLERAYDKRHGLDLVAGPGARHVTLDPSLLRPILSNLIGNAIKFSPEANTVHVALHVDAHEAVIRVTDHGIGIPAEQREAVLQPFNRGSNVGAISGSGLGLTIAQQAVARHGGSMQLLSEVGKGTEVEVRLPLAT
jgi:signal transduction histidine kinase